MPVIVEALGGSPIYTGLFDASGDPLPNIIALVDDIYDNGMGVAEQPVAGIDAGQVEFHQPLVG